MASLEEREHFRRIAAQEAALSAAALEASARRSPGENLEEGLALSDFALAFGGTTTRPPPRALIELERALRRAHPR